MKGIEAVKSNIQASRWPAGRHGRGCSHAARAAAGQRLLRATPPLPPCPPSQPADRRHPCCPARLALQAAKAVSRVLRTSLGPKGMDKLLQGPDGDIVISE